MRRGSQNNCSSTKSAHRDTNSLYVKTSQLERKIIGRSHPTRGILDSTRESYKSRRRGILDATTRFRAQELGIRAILPKIVEPYLEGDKVADLIFTTLLATSVLELTYSFNFSYFPSFGFLLQWRLTWIFVTLTCWKVVAKPGVQACVVILNLQCHTHMVLVIL
jgi:hypothetical protein